jgi:hypothetical protein
VDLGDKLLKQHNLSRRNQLKMIRNRKNRKIIHRKEMFKVNLVMIMVQIMTKKINQNNLVNSNKKILAIF